ncbi:MAG: hypothetical protein QF599_00830 [Planctomycetota bacterium]|nr:hypothetical protein [Planctomycetota bacterium]
MKSSSVRLTHTANLLVCLSGLLYGGLRYCARREGDFGPESHPAEDPLRSLHIVTAPLLIWAVAAIWHEHIWPSLRAGIQTRRRTGLTLTISFAPMVLSAYLLQVSVEDAWRSLWLWLHLASSGLWLVTMLIHLVLPRAPRLPDESTPG